MKRMSRWVEAASFEEFKEKKIISISYESVEIALVLHENTVYAFLDKCTHMDAKLSEGTLDGHVITCPLHGAKFDIRSGAVLSLPAASPLEVVPVKVENNKILIDVSNL